MYGICKLEQHHNKRDFSCGIEPLDRYLKTSARQEMKRNLAITYVLATLQTPDNLIGYYTLATTHLDASALPSHFTQKLPKYPKLPATLLARLALDTRYQGQKLGGHLIADALKRSLSISKQIGMFMVLVDAKDETATTFYRRYGFIPLPSNPLKLFLPMETIKALGLLDEAHSLVG